MPLVAVSPAQGGLCQCPGVRPPRGSVSSCPSPRPCPCPAVQLVPAASNALMLPDARAHHKHVVTSSRGHGSQQGHLPRPPARGHPAVTLEAPAGDPAGDPRWPQGP